jgi:hypothetical protein
MEQIIGERVHFELQGTDLTMATKVVIYDNDGGIRTLLSRERLVITDIQVSAGAAMTVDVFGGAGTSPSAGERMFRAAFTTSLGTNAAKFKSPIYLAPGRYPMVLASAAGTVTVIGTGVICNTGVGTVTDYADPMPTYVYGDRDVARTMFNGSIVRFLDLGDSFVEQAGTEFQQMFPLPNGGVWIGSPSLPFFATYGANNTVGFGAAGAALGVYTPALRVAEVTFNGVAPAGGGGTNADRIFDGSSSLLARTDQFAWHRSWDWLYGRTGTMTALAVGTGTDVANIKVALRKTAVAVDTPLAITATLPASALGTVTATSVAVNAATVSANESINAVMLFGSGAVPGIPSYFSLIGVRVELAASYAPFIVYQNDGKGSLKVSWFLDVTKVNQTAFAKSIQLGGYTHVRIHSGLNETQSASVIAADLRSVIAVIRSLSPAVKIILECPAVVDEIYRAALTEVNIAMKAVALDTAGVMYTSLFEKYQDPTAIASLISGFHPTAAGRSRFHADAIQLYIAAAST